MKIFLSETMPWPCFLPSGAYHRNQNWAVEIDGEVFYGARSKEDLIKATERQPHKPYYRIAY